MKFEEVLPALRAGKKIANEQLKKSGYRYIYYKDGIVFNEKNNLMYLTDKEIVENDDWEIVKEPKKVKLRDLTEEQFNKWAYENCGKYDDKCNGCPFQKVYCDRNPDIDDWWIKNKDLYSDKFLDQEVEFEKEK